MMGIEIEIEKEMLSQEGVTGMRAVTRTETETETETEMIETRGEVRIAMMAAQVVVVTGIRTEIGIGIETEMTVAGGVVQEAGTGPGITTRRGTRIGTETGIETGIETEMHENTGGTTALALDGIIVIGTATGTEIEIETETETVIVIETGIVIAIVTETEIAATEAEARVPLGDAAGIEVGDSISRPLPPSSARRCRILLEDPCLKTCRSSSTCVDMFALPFAARKEGWMNSFGLAWVSSGCLSAS